MRADYHFIAQVAATGRCGLLGALGLVLLACAMPPAPPPILSLEGRSCAASPDLGAALPLPLDPKKPVQVTVDGTTACWQPAGGAKSIYLAFQLPQQDEPYLVSVASAQLGSGLFSPHLLLLDAQGALLREVPRDTFLFHGTSLYAGIRVHTGERYLIVASDPPTVGQRTVRIAGGTQVSGAMVGTAYVQIHTGYEAANYVVFSHNGVVRVAAEPLPKLN